MGSGSYSSTVRLMRTTKMGYDTKSTQEIFTQKNINNAMSPYGLGIRESRDSNEHPESFPIILALDVTGSMGSVPHFLVKEGLPAIMDGIISAGIVDPQVLFLGIGDHEYDQAPIQVGQFESSDELLDKWLTDIYLEGGGGGNDGESYFLAWYLAAKHTETDSFLKRNRKGVLFTIGDEHTLNYFPGTVAKTIFGDGQYSDSYSDSELLEEAMKTYNVFHININETNSGSRQSVKDSWTQLLADNVLFAEKRTSVADIIIDKVVTIYNNSLVVPAAGVREDHSISDVDLWNKEEDML